MPGVSFERWQFVMSLFYTFAFVTHADIDHIDDLEEKIGPSIERYDRKYEYYKTALYHLISDISRYTGPVGIGRHLDRRKLVGKRCQIFNKRKYPLRVKTSRLRG